MSFEQLETEMDVTEAKFIPIVMKEMKKKLRTPRHVL